MWVYMRTFCKQKYSTYNSHNSIYVNSHYLYKMLAKILTTWTSQKIYNKQNDIYYKIMVIMKVLKTKILQK